uniref:Uncharacterized protein n=1 Tax=Arundo donax TaxID=35708 RepID=A0A0A8Z6Y1_ARUDO
MHSSSDHLFLKDCTHAPPRFILKITLISTTS